MQIDLERYSNQEATGKLKAWGAWPQRCPTFSVVLKGGEILDTICLQSDVLRDILHRYKTIQGDE